MQQLSRSQPVTRVTPADHSFFGYYDKCPWSPDGGTLLAGRAEFDTRMPGPDDALTLGRIELATGQFEPFGRTTAWSWQQGCMLQWLPSGEVLYNARHANGETVAIVRNLADGDIRVLPKPVCYVSADGVRALCINFHRLHVTRAGYGYPPALALSPEQFAPEDDGLWEMDLTTGEYRLILSLTDAVRLGTPMWGPEMWHWLNHATYSPDGERIAVLHRWASPEWGTDVFLTRLITLSRTGNDRFVVNGAGFTSHFVWRDSGHILAWASVLTSDGAVSPPGYFLFADHTGESRQIGAGVLTRDGHVTYSADGTWLLTDEYPREGDGRQVLTLYELDTGRRVDVGLFESHPDLQGPMRCDLHPRFNHDCTQICIDSAHSGARHMYIVDVREIVG